MRSTARPAMARPSASRCRPASETSDMRKPSPRRRSRSTQSSSRCASAGSSHAPKPRTRRGTGASVTRPISPSISGSAEAEPQATMICGSAERNTCARSSFARAASSSATSPLSRCVHCLRPVRCSSAVIVAKITRPTTSDTPTTFGSWIGCSASCVCASAGAVSASDETPAASRASFARSPAARRKGFGKRALEAASAFGRFSSITM